MSTRGIYTFKGFGKTYHAYKHHDNYITGAATHLKSALTNCWELPRYEPDEFAAAFIAANKNGPGDLRISKSRTTHCDVEYGYTIYPARNGDLCIEVVSTDYWDSKREKKIWEGRLLDFIVNAETIENNWYEEE